MERLLKQLLKRRLHTNKQPAAQKKVSARDRWYSLESNEPPHLDLDLSAAQPMLSTDDYTSTNVERDSCRR